MVFWVFCPIIPRRFPLLLSWVTVEVTPPHRRHPRPLRRHPRAGGDPGVQTRFLKWKGL